MINGHAAFILRGLITGHQNWASAETIDGQFKPAQRSGQQRQAGQDLVHVHWKGTDSQSC